MRRRRPYGLLLKVQQHRVGLLYRQIEIWSSMERVVVYSGLQMLTMAASGVRSVCRCGIREMFNGLIIQVQLFGKRIPHKLDNVSIDYEYRSSAVRFELSWISDIDYSLKRYTFHSSIDICANWNLFELICCFVRSPGKCLTDTDDCSVVSPCLMI